MAVDGWILDKSAAARLDDPRDAGAARRACREALDLPGRRAGTALLRAIGSRLRRSRDGIRDTFPRAAAPPDVFERALALQRDLAHHHGLWHRTPHPDLLIAETALHHGLGVVHVDRDYDRIAEVRLLTVRRLR